ncbi:MAG: hypothetical protein ACYTGQ_07535, partial [Planctomycetota bacterium]
MPTEDPHRRWNLPRVAAVVSVIVLLIVANLWRHADPITAQPQSPRFNPVFNLDNLTLPAASIRSGGPAI